LALAGVILMTNDSGLAVLLVNCLASALSCVAAGLLLWRISGRHPTLVSLMAVVFFPLSIYYCASSLSDTFVTMTMLGWLAAVVCLFQSPTLGRGLLAGLAFALAALSKPVVLPLPLLLLGYAAFKHPKTLRSLAAGLLVGGLFVAGWTVRNHRLTGTWIPVAGGTGFNLLVGNFMIEEARDSDTSMAHGTARALEQLTAVAGRVVSLEDLRTDGHFDVPLWLDRLCGRHALAMYRQDLWLLPRKVLTNVVRFWYFSSSPRKSLANALVNLSVLLLAGVWFVRQGRQAATAATVVPWVLIGLVLTYSIIIVHSSRFCLPVVMALVPMAAQQLVLLQSSKGRSASGGR
jgi:hypothetical protein